MLPSTKRKLIKDKKAQTTRILSKRQRKNLEKIIDKKKKKSERTQLIEKLQNVQVPDTELALLTSLSSIQVISPRITMLPRRQPKTTKSNVTLGFKFESLSHFRLKG